MVELKHFDTRLNQWLHTDGDRHNPESILQEKLNNTLLEFFLPDKQLSFGQMDEYSTPEDLKNHPDNHILLFSSKSRLVYGHPDCLEVVEKLCPDRKDRGAYGSIFLGSCKNSINEKLNILVVDDTTGNNGDILPNDVAYRLTGDCYGQISTHLYERLTQKESNSEEPYRLIQHRFGWREIDGKDNKYRFGKGTLRPCNLNEIQYKTTINKPAIDLIVPLSSFKGTDKDNPRGASKPQIKPGLYTQTIWLGEKDSSQKGKTAISQMIASFPNGIKDVIEELETQAQILAQIQNDPRKVAELYCDRYEKRKAFNQQKQVSLEEAVTQLANSSNFQTQLELIAPTAELDNELSNGLDLDENNDLDPSQSKAKEDLFMYTLIKADLQNHCQLLETEKVKNELTRFLQNQWRDIAIGRTLTFDRGMIFPSKELKNGEICVPWFEEGEKVLNFRSPFLNSNGLCVSVNKHVTDYLAPNGKPLEGVIVVNDEDHKRIQNRLEKLRAQGDETTEIDPPETECERQGRDFDGDCIGVELGRKYPNLTSECEYRNLPENAYAPTVKLQKQSFYKENSSQPEFENIAIFMSDSISVGIINNQVTALEALESEVEILKLYGTPQQKIEYLDKVANHYKILLNKENTKSIINFNEELENIIDLSNKKTPQSVNQALDINRSLYRSLIEEACFQNQIAVDMFKSARSPDMNLIKQSKTYLYRDVNYIKDKKTPTIYLNECITPNGYSPVELLISQANNYFQNSQLESRPIIQFKDLFKDIEFTTQHKLAAIVANEEFNQKFNEASRLSQRCKIEQGPYAIIKSNSGAYLEITNLTRFNHPTIWQAQRINLSLKEIPKEKRSIERPHQLLAVAQINGEMQNGKPKYRPLGTVSQRSVADNHLKAGMKTNDASLIEIRPELKQSQTKLLFKEAIAVAENFRNSIPEPERLSAAAAVWAISATREEQVEDKNSTESQEANHEGSFQVHHKASNFVFAAFPDKVISQVNQLQFTKLKLLGISNDNFKKSSWDLEKPFEVEVTSPKCLAENNQQNSRFITVKNNNGEQQEFVLEQRTGRLPIGTKAQATLLLGDCYTAKATIAAPDKPPIEFTIREISKFSFSNNIFDGKKAMLSINKIPVPTNVVKVKIDDKTLGELDSDSIKELEKKNYLSNNSSISVKLKPIGQDNGAFIIGESSKGNFIRINKVNFYDFKNEVFDENSYKKINFEIQPSKMRDAVFLDGKLLGVLHLQKDKDALKQLGIIKPGREGKVTCLLQSNHSHAFVCINPASVQYPKTWTKDIYQEALPKVTEANKHLLQKLKEKPTVLFNSQEDKVFGFVGLSVDSSKTAIVEKWLQARAIAYEPVSSQQATLKGLSTYYLTTNTIAPQDWQGLVERFGTPLDDSSKNSAYSQYLQSLPDRRIELAPSEQATPTSYFLPTLLAQEDYEWEVIPGTFVDKPTTRITVDDRKTEALTTYFNNLGINPTRATDPYDIPLESKLGYAVFRIPNEIIPFPVHIKLEQQLGKPLDAHHNGNYYSRLAEIEQQNMSGKPNFNSPHLKQQLNTHNSKSNQSITKNHPGNPLKQVIPLDSKQISLLPQVSPAQKLSLAIAAKNILINKNQTSVELKGYYIEQTGNLLTVAARDGRAEILRLHGSDVIFEQLEVEDISRFQEFQKNLEQKAEPYEQRHSQNNAEVVELSV